ncbi:acyl-CoA dehydrogenase family protein [Streptomyces chumphonensis]|uniref:Acyl-CoA/acyl-ACP dehydrogenase n=1 Tax=Streptomyces chumphonensis TaxID=1214925 RepID=A0A927F1S9_9ACTN|nr:acyl-CoA dehydrogenase family protein [Streptomyces chumphonensis]MBD3933117.1 acyl-CoA/acyl-ACP dehydrogenase [Streptomyces chumphonensis]
MSERQPCWSEFTAPDAEYTEERLPGLISALAEHDLGRLEDADSPVLELFRRAGGPGLLIPEAHGGLGLDCRGALRVQSSLATLSPSLGVGTMMHHLAVVSFVEYLRVHVGDDAPQWALLASIANNGHLVASASSEARRGDDALVPNTTATAVDDGAGYVLNGAKKPCSLARSMDILTTSVRVRSADERDGTVALAVLPATLEGVSVRPFWRSPVLVAAESEEVVLDDVRVPSVMLLPGGHPESGMDELQVRAWIWFEVLACGTYLGTAQALFDRAAASPRTDRRALGEAAAELFGYRSTCQAAAGVLDSGATAESAMTAALLARTLVEERLPNLCARLAGLLGGLAFVGSGDVGLLLATSRALAFHPPSRVRTTESLGGHFGGAPLDLSIF